MKRTDKEVEEKIIQEYKEGSSMLAVGKRYSVNAVTVMNILDRYGIEKRTHGGIYQVDRQKIAQMYREGKSCAEICKEFDVCEHTITNTLETMGIERNNLYHNLDLREDYWESIDTPDKAYFLGFLITDGNVCGTNVALSIHAKDAYILDVFKEVTGNANNLYEDKRSPMKTFHAKRPKWVSDLAKYGMVPRKTYSAYMPELPDDMMSHFIRGLIDGDGCISYKSHAIEFCGHVSLVEGVRDYLCGKLGVYKVKVIKRKCHLWQISWAGRGDVKKIGEYIYADKRNLFLTRKYENYLKIIQANTEVSTAIAKGAVTP